MLSDAVCLVLMSKWSYTLQGMHKFSFFKQTVYIVLMASVFLSTLFLTPLAFLIYSFFVFT